MLRPTATAPHLDSTGMRRSARFHFSCPWRRSGTLDACTGATSAACEAGFEAAREALELGHRQLVDAARAAPAAAGGELAAELVGAQRRGLRHPHARGVAAAR